MSEHNNVAATNDAIDPTSQEFLMGMANTVQASLMGVHNFSNQDVVLQGIVMYVRSAADAHDESPRAYWNKMAVRLRDFYFALDRQQAQVAGTTEGPGEPA